MESKECWRSLNYAMWRNAAFLVLSVFAPLSLWVVLTLALSTISLASRCSVASLWLQLAFSILSLASRSSSISVASFPLWLALSTLSWPLCISPSLQLVYHVPSVAGDELRLVLWACLALSSSVQQFCWVDAVSCALIDGEAWFLSSVLCQMFHVWENFCTKLEHWNVNVRGQTISIWLALWGLLRLTPIIMSKPKLPRNIHLPWLIKASIAFTLPTCILMPTFPTPLVRTQWINLEIGSVLWNLL